MFRINDNFCKLAESYLFSEVARRINAFKTAHPDADVIRMGIGDVTRPLCAAAIEAMHKAVDDEASSETFHGYGPEVSRSNPTKFSLATEPKAIQGTSEIFLPAATVWRLQIRSIRSM